MWPQVKPEETPIPESLKQLLLKNGATGRAPERYFESDIYTGMSDFSKYDINSFVTGDLNDTRAFRQSNPEAIANMLGKFVGKTAVRTLDSIFGIPTAIGTLATGLVDGQVNSIATGFEAIYDNPFSKSMRSVEHWLDEQLPVYETRRDQAKLSANAAFADKLLDGVSYMASIALGMAAGRGIVSGATKAGGKLGQLIKLHGAKNVAKVLDAAAAEGRTMDYAINTLSSSAKMLEELKRIEGLNKGSGALKSTMLTLWSSIVESSAEASETREAIEQNLTQQYLERNGGQPLTDAQKAEIREQSAQGGMWNFLANVAVTSAAHKVVLGKMFNSRWSNDALAASKIIREGEEYALKEAKTKVGKYLKAIGKSPIFTGALAEGAQEGTQFFTNNFFTRLHSIPDADSVWATANLMSSLTDSIADMGTKEAVESMIIGALIGGPIGGYLNRHEYKEKVEKARKYMNIANANTTSKVLKSMAKINDLANIEDGAVYSGDRVTFETAKAAGIHEWVYSRLELGKFGDIKEDLDTARSMPLADFKQAYEIEDANFTEEDKNSYIDYIQGIANSVAKSHKALVGNLGPRLAELERENPEAEITKYLVLLDVLKDDYIRREEALINKLRPYMDQQAIIDNALTPERRKQFIEEIQDLDKRVKQLQAELPSSTDPEATTKSLTELITQLSNKQQEFARAITDANYKDFMKLPDTLEEKESKRAEEKTLYAEYSKDIKDLKAIQELKETLINHYHKILNDTDYARQVQKDILLANQSQVLDNLFTINFDVAVDEDIVVEQPDKEEATKVRTDLVFTPSEGAGQAQDYIRVGDIYSLNMPYRRYDKTKNNYVNFTAYNPFEVVETSVEVINGMPVGKVKVQEPGGPIRELTVDQFKAHIRPIQYKDKEGNLHYVGHKYSLAPEEERFYKLYKDRAIQYKTAQGEIVEGMLGINYQARLVLKYFDKDGKLHVTPFNTVRYNKNTGGYLKIYSPRETMAYKVKDGMLWYINGLNKIIERSNKQLSKVSGFAEALQRRIKEAETTPDSKLKFLQAFQKNIEKWLGDIERELEIKKTTLAYLEDLKNKRLEKSEDFDTALNEAVDHILSYKEAFTQLKQENPELAELSWRSFSEAFKFDVDGQELGIKEIRDLEKTIKQEFITTVKAKLNNIRKDPDSDTNPITSFEAQEHLNNLNDRNLNPTYEFEYATALDIAKVLRMEDVADSSVEKVMEMEELLEKANEVYNNYKTKEAERQAKVMEILGKDPNNPDVVSLFNQYRYAEYEAAVQLTKIVNSRGYWPNEGYRMQKVEETEYNLDEVPTLTSRPEFVLKTTGNSLKTTNRHKKAFAERIATIDPTKHTAIVILPDKFKEYDLQAHGEMDGDVMVEDPIYVMVADAGHNPITVPGLKAPNHLITTLPLPTLSDTVGIRFRNAEGVPNAESIAKALSDVYTVFKESNGTEEYLDILDRTVQVLKDNHTEAKDIIFIDQAAKYLKDLYTLREAIKEEIEKGGDELIALNIVDKSNGIPKTTNVNSTRGLDGDGKIVVADSDSIDLGSNTFRVTPGRAYYVDETHRVLLPVITGRLKDASFKYGKDKVYTKTFVDQVLDAASFIQASVEGKAFNKINPQRPKKIDPREALTLVNNNLSKFVYTTRDTSKPNTLFNIELINNEVVLNVGTTTIPFGDPAFESQLREAIGARVLNINRALLQDDNNFTLHIFSKEQDGSVSIFGYVYDNYNNWVMENFKVQSNLDTYQNGYIILDSKVNRVVAKTTTSTNSTGNSTSSSSTGTRSKGGGLARVSKSRRAKLAKTGPSTAADVLAELDEDTDTDTDSSDDADTQNDDDSSEPDGALNIANLPRRNVKPRKLTASNTAQPDNAQDEAEAEDNTEEDSDDSGTPAIPPRRSGPYRPRRGLKLLASTVVGEARMSEAQLARAEEKFKSKYGVSFTLVKGLVDNDAYGLVTEAGEVLLSEEAIVGTDYHEEFHLVSQHILSADELRSLYDNWREVNNEPNLSDDIVEERLAEEFRNYALNRDAGKVKAGSLIERLFNKLINYIKALLNLKSEVITDLFEDIYSGKFYNKDIYKSTKSFKSTAIKSVDTIPADVKQTAFRAITKNFIDNLILAYREKNYNASYKDKVEKDPYTQEEIEIQTNFAILDLATNKTERVALLNDTLTIPISESKTRTINVLDFSLNAAISKYLKVQDANVAKVNAGLVTQEDIDTFKAEAFELISGELNLKGEEIQSVETEETDRSIIKVGDTEVDHFSDARSTLKFLFYLQAPNGVDPLNPSALTKLYMDNLVGITNSTEFFRELELLPDKELPFDEEYKEAVRNINNLIGLPITNDTDIAQVALQNTFFRLFAKEEVAYMALGIREDPRGSTEYYWIDQSKVKQLESAKQDFVNELKLKWNELRANASKFTTERKRNEYLFQELFGRPYRSDAFKEVASILKTLVSYEDVNRYLYDKRGDVNRMVEYIVDNNPTRIFSLRTVDGKPQYSLQNPASIHRRLREYKKNLTPRQASLLSLDSFMYLNGVKLEGARIYEDRTIYQETTTRASRLSDSELFAMFYHGIMNDQIKIIPFIFNGDKTSLPGFKISGRAFTEVSDRRWVGHHSEILRNIFKEEIALAHRLHKFQTEKEGRIPEIVTSKKYKLSLPYYSFLTTTKEGAKIYEKILEDIKGLSRTASAEEYDAIQQKYQRAVDIQYQKYLESRRQSTHDLLVSLGIDYIEKTRPRKNAAGKEVPGEFLDAEDVLDFFNSAFSLGIYEQHKLVGDLNFYADPAKRLNLWTAAKQPIRTDPAYLKWFSEVYGYEVTPELRTLVVDDIKPNEKVLGSSEWAGTEPADGQGWISYKAVKFLLASGSGTYNYALDGLFYNLDELERKSRLTAEDIKTYNNLIAELDSYLNILKPQFAGMQKLYPGDDIEIPTTYKFSVAPITRDIAQGKNLEHLYDLMEEGKIDLVMPASANKVGRITAGEDTRMYDDEGNWILSWDKVQNSVQTTLWEDIGIQVEMPNPHRKVTFGTQMRKLFTENLSYLDNVLYKISTRKGEGRVPPQVVMRDFEELIKRKLYDDFNKFTKSLGLDETLRLDRAEDINKVKEYLAKVVRLSGNNFALLQDIAALDTYDFAASKVKLQGILNSILDKKVIKQKMFGDAKAMVSSVGFEKKNGGIKKDRRLKFYEKGEGKQHMEIYLPITEQYYQHTYWDAEAGLFKFKSGTDERIKRAIGFRIPTQSAASIENIVIAGFLPRDKGNYVVVPFELPKKAGSDFDIDKLNIFLPVLEKTYPDTNINDVLQEISSHYFRGARGKSRIAYYNSIKDLDPNELTPAEQTIIKTVRRKLQGNSVYNENNIDNQILEFMTTLMENEAYYPLFAQTIDTGVIKEIALDIEAKRIANGSLVDKSDSAGHYNWYDPSFVASRRYNVITAKETLGAAALATVHHAEAQKHRIAFNDRAGVLASLLQRFVPGISEDGRTVRFDRVYSFDAKGKESKIPISQYLSEFINSFVDALKGDYITSVNVNLETINVAMLLTRAGISPEQTLHFLSQPGVLSYTEKKKAIKSAVKSNSASLKAIKQMYSSNIIPDLSIEALKATLEDTNPMNKTQLGYASLYMKLEEYADILQGLVKATTFDTKGTDKTIEENEANLMFFDHYTKNYGHYWINYDSLVNASTSFTAAMRDVANQSRDFVNGLLNIGLLYDTSLGGEALVPKLKEEYTSTINKVIAKKMSSGDMVERLNKLKQYYLTYLLQAQAAKHLGSKEMLLSRVRRARARLKNDIATGKVKDNYFLKNLKIIDDRIYAYNGAGLDADELGLRQKAFMELYRLDKQYAEDLALAALVIHGEVNNPFTFRPQIPGNIILKTIGISDNSVPLLTIVSQMTTEELNAGVTKAKQFVESPYNSKITNYMLAASVADAEVTINGLESYTEC